VRTVVSVLGMVCLTSGVLACRDSFSAVPVACVVDAATITVTAGNLMPKFSWAPNCAVGMVEVRSDSSPVGWTLQANSNRIFPPVGYGQSPAGMQASSPPPLVHGMTYWVSVWLRLDSGPGGPDYERVTATSFVP
jgi:hypothetical protein